MSSASPAPRTSAYQPALAALAAAACGWSFVTVALGAFTTTIGAGMAFPDWPLSNGSLNPHGWLTNIAMFAEHSHRLSVGMLSLLTLAVAIWISRTEGRRWLRRLAWFAFGLVLLQALVGGLRVLLDPDQVKPIATSVGELFAMLHACLAQLFVCTLFAIATACSRSWISCEAPVSDGLRRTGVICCVLLFIQLAIAAVMRHSNAGLAIPSFPWSGPDHALLPPAWDFRVAIHFAHRAMALVLTVALVWFAARVWRDRGATLALRCGASAIVSLLALQILLGATIIRTQRDPGITTAHVIVGALTLATTFWLTWSAHRDVFEGASPRPA
jgi:cytochrome c oxidase assembly protein subunit 15